MRLSIQFAVLLMALNAVGFMLTGSGFAAATGIHGPGEEQAINDFEKESKNRPQFGGGALQSLFGMYATAASFVNDLFTFLTAGPNMLKSGLFPSWFIDPLTGLMYFWMAADLIYVAIQRSL